MTAADLLRIVVHTVDREDLRREVIASKARAVAFEHVAAARFPAGLDPDPALEAQAALAAMEHDLLCAALRYATEAHSRIAPEAHARKGEP